MKVKYDQYMIDFKRKRYKVVVFPYLENLYCYDDYPTESTYDISGDVNSMKEVARAFSICIRDPAAIVYLPQKTYKTTYNMVLTRHSIEGFKPSRWYKLKSRIGKKTWIGKYAFEYDEKKLREYVAANNDFADAVSSKQSNRQFIQKELGDTIFWQMSLTDYYLYHASILSSCDYMETNPGSIRSCWGIGWVSSEEIMRAQKEYYEKYDCW